MFSGLSTFLPPQKLCGRLKMIQLSLQLRSLLHARYSVTRHLPCGIVRVITAGTLICLLAKDCSVVVYAFKRTAVALSSCDDPVGFYSATSEVIKN